jgi:hypothetical protein
VYNTILSRDSLEIEQLVLDDHSKQRGTIEGRLRFYDYSRLEFDEVVLVRDKQLVKLRYAYHYQNAQSELIFRYDNAPHHPTIATFPHHKHVEMKVEPAAAPDLSEVLREIELLIY